MIRTTTMTALGLLYLLTCTNNTLLAQAIQWPISAGGNGHFYTIGTVLLWDQADAEAVSLGGHLVAVNSQAEQDFLFSHFNGPFFSYWIGLTDQSSFGNFQWTTGEPLNFTYWQPGEPNNIGLEHWGIMDMVPGPNGRWNNGLNVFPSDLRPGIIELTSVPEPSSVVFASLALLASVVRQQRFKTDHTRNRQTIVQ